MTRREIRKAVLVAIEERFAHVCIEILERIEELEKLRHEVRALSTKQ